MSPSSVAPPFPLDQADLCVKCGLCLPHCPTYALTAHEGDSPRGRIALMQGLASDVLDAGEQLTAHLDGCLGCRSCEKVCPAQVPYGRLIDAGRTLLAQRDPQRLRVTRLLAQVLTRAWAQRFMRGLLWTYDRSSLQRLARRLRLTGRGRLARLESLLPDRIERKNATPLVGKTRVGVQLFSGCVSSIVDQATLNAARRLCAHLGIEVEEPDTQTCCGALHQHAGMPEAAQQLATRNLDAFPGSHAVAWCASGCGATLSEYGQLSVDPRAATFARRTTDIHRVLAAHWPDQLVPQPLAARVLLHLPCTQRNVTGGGALIEELLGRIPQLRVERLDAGGCCGAAGSHCVTHPEAADQLLATALDHIEARAPDYVLSSNIGCALHLAGGLRRRALRIPVLHPLQLLERQLTAAARADGTAALRAAASTVRQARSG